MKTTTTNRTTVRPIGHVLNALENVQSNKDQYRAKCPVHQKPDSRKRTLSIKETPDGKVMIHCFAGCHYEDVLEAVGLTKADLFPETHDPEWVRIKRKSDADLRQVIENAKPYATLVQVYVSEMLKPKNWTAIATALHLEPRDKWVLEGAAESLREVLDA